MHQSSKHTPFSPSSPDTRIYNHAQDEDDDVHVDIPGDDEPGTPHRRASTHHTSSAVGFNISVPNQHAESNDEIDRFDDMPAENIGGMSAAEACRAQMIKSGTGDVQSEQGGQRQEMSSSGGKSSSSNASGSGSSCSSSRDSEEISDVYFPQLHQDQEEQKKGEEGEGEGEGEEEEEEQQESPGENEESPHFGQDPLEGETTKQDQDNDLLTGNGEQDAAQTTADSDNLQEKPEEKRWHGWPGHNAFRLLVPIHKAGAVIGHKGVIVKKIAEETKTFIKVINAPHGTQESVVFITAKEEPDLPVSPAMDALFRVHKRVVDGLDDESEQSAPSTGTVGRTRLLVPHAQAATIIGFQQGTRNKIQEDSNATVLVSPILPPLALYDDRVVEIRGEPAAMHKALELITSYLRKFLVHHSILPLFESQTQHQQKVQRDQLILGQLPWGPPPQNYPPPNSGCGPGYGGPPPQHYMLPPSAPPELQPRYEKPPSYAAPAYAPDQPPPPGTHSSAAQLPPHVVTQVTLPPLFESQTQHQQKVQRDQLMSGQQPWDPPPQNYPPPYSGSDPGYGGPPPQHYMLPPSAPPELQPRYEKPPSYAAPAYAPDQPPPPGTHSSAAQLPPHVVTQVTLHMQVPISYAYAIIGVNGENISYIRRASGATVTVQETRGVPGEITVEMVGGRVQQVQTAQQLIQNFMAEADALVGGTAAPALAVAPANAPVDAAYGSTHHM